VFRERILPGGFRKYFDRSLRHSVRSNQRGCPRRHFALREFAALGDERTERLTFSPLLPPNIPSKIFHVLGDGFQLNRVASVLRDRQPQLSLWFCDDTRGRVSRSISDVFHMWITRVCTITQPNRETRCDKCFSARRYPVLYPYDTEILRQTYEKESRGAAWYSWITRGIVRRCVSFIVAKSA